MTASGVAVIQSTGPGEVTLDGRRWALPVLELAGESGHAADQLRVRAQRVERLAGMIVRKIGRCDLAVFEGGSFASARSSRALSDERAALRLRIVGLLDCPVGIVAPGTLKVFVAGNGRAGKKEMVDSTLASYELGTRDDNLIDAFGLARMGAMHLGHPIEEPTEDHRRAIAAVKWESEDSWITE